MKRFSFLLVALLGFGCASDADREFGRELSRITTVEPPTFLDAGVAQIFGRASFTARLEAQKGLSGSRPPMVGELYGKDGSLFFISDEQRGKKGIAGGVSALWHEPTGTAYLLNEPLQAYAPFRQDAYATNSPLEVAQAGEEEMNGQRCRKSVLSRRLGDQAIPQFIVWRAVDFQDLPVRIQTTNNTAVVTLTLSRIQLRAPAPGLFALPDGFKKYESTDAMLGELVRRRTDALSGRAKMNRERYGAPDTSLDDEPAPTARPLRPY